MEVAEDDARQVERQAEVKETVGSHVRAEITDRAARTSASERDKVAEVATKAREDAVDESEKADRAVGQARKAARGSQFIDYAFGVVYTLLAIRLGLALIAAQSSNAFVRMIASVTDPFYAPFRGIIPSPAAEGGYTLVAPILIAVAAYAVLHAGINGLLRLVSSRKTAI